MPRTGTSPVHPAHNHYCPNCGYEWHHKERKAGNGCKCPYPTAHPCCFECRAALNAAEFRPLTPGTHVEHYTYNGPGSAPTVSRHTVKLRGAYTS